MKTTTQRPLAALCGFAALLVLTGTGALLLVRPANATAAFAAATGKSCGDCHTVASGGGPLTPFGEKFKANGNKLPK
jgi:hypothetical protein